METIKSMIKEAQTLESSDVKEAAYFKYLSVVYQIHKELTGFTFLDNQNEILRDKKIAEDLKSDNRNNIITRRRKLIQQALECLKRAYVCLQSASDCTSEQAEMAMRTTQVITGKDRQQHSNNQRQAAFMAERRVSKSFDEEDVNKDPEFMKREPVLIASPAVRTGVGPFSYNQRQ